VACPSREVPGVWEDLELGDSWRDGTDDLARRLDRCDRVELTHGHQCRGPDVGELLGEVELVGQLGAAGCEVEVPSASCERLLAGDVGAERSVDTLPFGVGDGLVAVVTACDVGDLVAGDAADGVDEPVDVEACVARARDQSGRVPGPRPSRTEGVSRSPVSGRLSPFGVPTRGRSVPVHWRRYRSVVPVPSRACRLGHACRERCRPPTLALWRSTGTQPGSRRAVRTGAQDRSGVVGFCHG
jgi:hypothetical protein